MERVQAVQSPTSVYVVTKAGDLLDSASYVNRVVAEVEKESRQAVPREPAASRYREPRHAFADLLAFYDINPWHRRCVNLKALLATGLGWQLVRAEGDVNDAERVVYDSKQRRGDTSHPAVKLCLRPSVGERLSIADLAYRLLIDYGAVGNAFLEVVRDAKGRPAELYHARALRMRRANDLRSVRDAFWQTQVWGQRTEVPFAAYGSADAVNRSEILHLYAYDPHSDYYGIPSWLGALGMMGLERTMVLFNTRLFANSMMATYAVIVTGGRLSTEGREAIKAFIRDRVAGADNAGRILLLENEDDGVTVELKPLTMQLKNLLIVDAQKETREVVIGAHGVPPRLLGLVTPGQLGATGEVEGQLRTFRETVQIPLQEIMEDPINDVLAEVCEGHGVDVVRLRFTRMDVTNVRDDVDFFDTMLEREVLSVDEVRARVREGL